MRPFSPAWLKMLEGKRLLIFDFDGTIANTTPLHEAAFKQVLEPMGVTVDYSTIAGLKTRDAIRQCGERAGLTWDDLTIDDLARAKQEIVRESIKQGLQPLPGVDAFLQAARTRYHLAMVTSGSRTTVNLSLAQLGYSTVFEPILCAEDVGHAKPAPDGFLKCLEMTGVPAYEALVFEDSEAGFASAQAAGIDFEDARSFFLRGLIHHGH